MGRPFASPFFLSVGAVAKRAMRRTPTPKSVLAPIVAVVLFGGPGNPLCAQ